MSDFLISVSRAYSDPGPAGYALRIFTILVLAWLVSRVLGGLLPRLVFALGPRRWRQSFTARRVATQRDLVASIIRFASYVVALVVILEMFIDPGAILAVAGLFSFAFGMSARPLISDIFAGVTLLFEDQFAVGEKVELSGVVGTAGIIGLVEHVGLRTTHVRADSGELFIVPNGDVRVVRNFSRGEFSLASITVCVPAGRVSEALMMLQEVGRRAQAELPQIVEPPMVMSETGLLAAEVNLTLKVKTRLGQGVTVRAELLARAQKELAERGIHVVAS